MNRVLNEKGQISNNGGLIFLQAGYSFHCVQGKLFCVSALAQLWGCNLKGKIPCIVAVIERHSRSTDSWMMAL